MLKKYNIGLLGSTGSIGRIVDNLLSGEQDLTVLRGLRSHHTPASLRSAGLAEKPSCTVDIFNASQLDAFTAQCEIIVNCTAPSLRIKDTIALAAMKNKAHYVDAGGYQLLYEALQGCQADIRAAGLNFIISAGLIPGLTEVFLYYLHELATASLDRITAVEHFYGDSSVWSDNATRDIIWHIFNTAQPGKGFGYYVRGKWKGTPVFKLWRKVRLPFSLGRQKVLCNFESELLSFVARHPEYNKISSYSLFVDNSIFPAMMKIFFFLKNKPGKALVVLKKAFEDSHSLHNPGFVSLVRIKGLRDSRPVNISGLIADSDGYRVTALATYLTALQVLRRQIVRTGCQFINEAVDPLALIRSLAACGIKPKLMLDDTEISEEDLLVGKGRRSG